MPEPGKFEKQSLQVDAFFLLVWLKIFHFKMILGLVVRRLLYLLKKLMSSSAVEIVVKMRL